ncbi:glucose 1-dehydrogenase [Pseudomonas sp. LFS044]|jgi:NAD(P)-dependent dehydrogenase (short-subunit alcohol dehydrogenase family)|uniref:glucose 1-dehydrogenase n=1 Tax=Pseudomonas sp. LFS044 TaxID=3229880 RepID=UPI003A7F7A82
MTQQFNGSFEGKVAFVTGAGSGIGRATAIAFARAGAAVTAVDLSQHGLEETARLIDAAGGKVLSVVCNVTDSKAIKAAVEKTVATFGSLDCAFNNAGIEQQVATLPEIEEDVWDRVLAVNLKSVYLCMKHQLNVMLKHGGGAIVNTSSGAGVMAIQGQSAYCASKFGVTAISKCAALEHAGKGIRINALCPGIIDTEMMSRFTGDTEEGRARVIAQEPVGRMGRPEEIANAVLWLCSEQAGFVTGHAMIMDGGQTAGI